MRICKNKFTDHLRDIFDANPLKQPNPRYTPLNLIEIKDKRTFPLGRLDDLIHDDQVLDIPINKEPMSAISSSWSKKANIDVGVNLLSGFFKGFGLDIVGISASFKNAKQFSFSFEEVERHYFDPLRLGKVLSDNAVKVNTENIFINKIMASGKHRLGLITDAIVSNNFSVATFSDSDTSADIDVPAIKNYIADLNTKTTIEKNGNNVIKFVQPNPIPFAFSCVELKIDDDGNFIAGEWLENLRSLTGSNESSNRRIPRVLLDDDSFQPLFID